MKTPEYMTKGLDKLINASEKYTERSRNRVGKYLGRGQCPVTGDYFWHRSILNIPVGENRYMMISARALDFMSPEDIAEETLCESMSQSINKLSNSNGTGYSKYKKVRKQEKYFSKSEILEKMPEWEFLCKTGNIAYLRELEDKLAVLQREDFASYLHPPTPHKEPKQKKSLLEKIAEQRKAKNRD